MSSSSAGQQGTGGGPPLLPSRFDHPFVQIGQIIIMSAALLATVVNSAWWAMHTPPEPIALADTCAAILAVFGGLMIRLGHGASLDQVEGYLASIRGGAAP